MSLKPVPMNQFCVCEDEDYKKVFSQEYNGKDNYRPMGFYKVVHIHLNIHVFVLAESEEGAGSQAECDNELFKEKECVRIYKVPFMIRGWSNCKF